MSGSVVVRIFDDGAFVIHADATTRRRYRLLAVVAGLIQHDVDELAEKVRKLVRSLDSREEEAEEE